LVGRESGGKECCHRPFNHCKDDFDITTIDGDKVSGKDFWARCVNFKPSDALGCHIPVKAGDEVLWAYANTEKTKHYLKLTGPTVVKPFIPHVFLVTDGATGAPIEGATVNGVSSDDQGRATVAFKNLGAHRIKAEKNDDSIRSNTLIVEVARTPPAKL
jgi:hypothetical protein